VRAREKKNGEEDQTKAKFDLKDKGGRTASARIQQVEHGKNVMQEFQRTEEKGKRRGSRGPLYSNRLNRVGASNVPNQHKTWEEDREPM